MSAVLLGSYDFTIIRQTDAAGVGAIFAPDW
jgi:hypothetical protein